MLLIGGASAAVIVLTSMAGLSSVEAWVRVAMLAGAACIGGVAAIVDARGRARESSASDHAAAAITGTGFDAVPPNPLFQLPPDIDDFAGRQPEIQRAIAVLRGHALAREGVKIFVTAGQPGVGKTTLAVHVAHEVSRFYPDGQMYVNLRGVEAQALDPGETLAGFLRELGVARAAVPESLDERSRIFRAHLHNRRVLMVLDNAASEAQVRPLLPSSPGCGVIVTSRRVLPSLEGVQRIDLVEFDIGQSMELLVRIIGRQAVESDRDSAEEIARLCGGLPLAVRIAGSRLSTKQHWTLGSFAARLRDERHRLSELEAGDQAVRASFTLSYRGLAPEARKAFPTAARQEADSRAEAEILLRLGDVYKNSGRVDGPGGIPEPDREDLIGANFLERSLAVFQASGDLRGQVMALRRLGGVYRDLGQFERSERAYDEGLRIADLLTDADYARAYLLRGKGCLFRMTGRLDDAVVCFVTARPVFEQAQDIRGEIGSLRGLGETYLLQGLWSKAHDCFARHLELDLALQDRHGEAHSLRGLGVAALGHGRARTAITYFHHSLAIFREIGHRASEAETLTYEALALRVIHHFRAADAMERQAGAILVQLGLPPDTFKSLDAARRRFNGSRSVLHRALPLGRIRTHS